MGRLWTTPLILLCILPTWAGAATISTIGFARSPLDPLSHLPLPFSVATDSEGREFHADENGQIDFSQAKGNLTLALDSPFVQVPGPGDEPFMKILTPAQYQGTREIVWTDQDAPLTARMCRAHLEKARLAVVSALIGPIPAWFNRPLTCSVDFDEGCNAEWDGTQLMTDRGDSRCAAAALTADLLRHEYGHGVMEHLLPAGALNDSRVSEGAADLVFAFTTGDSRFGVGFWKDREISWLRDLSQPKVFPQDWRGTYTGSLTYSSAWWELRQAMIARLGQSAGAKLALKTYLHSLQLMKTQGFADPLHAAAAAALETAGATSFRCDASAIFARHGLGELASGCPISTAPVKTLCSYPREVLIPLVSDSPVAITDPAVPHVYGPWVTLPFEIPVGEPAAEVILEMTTDHPYPDDLLIGWRSHGGTGVHEFYKGEEEIPVPPALALARPELLTPGAHEIVIRDLARGISGSVLTARLRVRFGKPGDCRLAASGGNE
ncbi:MAG: hypothetical protein ACXWPM_08635 [Bdellovibrionota bacterium]